MKKIAKIIGWSLLGLVLLGGATLAIFSLSGDFSETGSEISIQG